MTGSLTFFDTNILLSVYDPADPVKQAAAHSLLHQAVLESTGVVSSQVLGEFFHTAVTRKALLTAEECLRVIEAFSAFKIAPIDGALVRAAIANHQRFGAGYWESLILATAVRAACKILWSEDFNAGQNYDGVTVRNPFAG